MEPRVFWRMTLAEWHAAKYWFDEPLTGEIRALAWSTSYLMRAAGCDADKVTPSKLLGEPEPIRRERMDPAVRKKLSVDRMWAKFQAKTDHEVGPTAVG